MASRSGPVTVSVAWLQEQLMTEAGKKGTRYVEISAWQNRRLLNSLTLLSLYQHCRIVDGTWHKPVWKRDAGAEYDRYFYTAAPIVVFYNSKAYMYPAVYQFNTECVR